MKKFIPEIERAIFLDGKYKAFGFKAGSCGLCERCNLWNVYECHNARHEEYQDCPDRVGVESGSLNSSSTPNN